MTLHWRAADGVSLFTIPEFAGTVNIFLLPSHNVDTSLYLPEKMPEYPGLFHRVYNNTIKLYYTTLA